jgi:hypothetical protein
MRSNKAQSCSETPPFTNIFFQERQTANNKWTTQCFILTQSVATSQDPDTLEDYTDLLKDGKESSSWSERRRKLGVEEVPELRLDGGDKPHSDRWRDAGGRSALVAAAAAWLQCQVGTGVVGTQLSRKRGCAAATRARGRWCWKARPCMGRGAVSPLLQFLGRHAGMRVHRRVLFFNEQHSTPEYARRMCFKLLIN